MVKNPELSTGERIQMVRTAVGLSQQDLASKVGVAKAMIGQWEIRNREPKLRSLAALANAMGCSVLWLATGAGEPLNADQPNGPLLEACVEIAQELAEAADVPAMAATLFRRSCEHGIGIRRGSRADLLPLVRAMAETT